MIRFCLKKDKFSEEKYIWNVFIMEEKSKKHYDKLCEGVPLAKGFPEEEFRAAMNYKPRVGDLFIVAYPRSGTTWMHYIVLLILRRGKLSDDPMDFYVGCPYLEMTGSEAADYIAAAGVARSHLPYHRMPMSKDAKYIYVCRNPKDCAVSFYNQMKDPHLDDFENSSFDEFFEYFLTGELPYGDYFEHVTAWYKHRNDPNVYIVTYESLKKDLKGEILKLAKFIGEEHEKALLNDAAIMDDILRYSSFDYMRKHTNEIMMKFKKREEIVSSSEDNKLPPGFKKLREFNKESETSMETKSHFIRKGIVGDWKNYFKPDQLKRLDERIAQKTANTEDVMSLWKGEIS